MRRRKLVLLVAFTAIYLLSAYARLWANQFSHPGIDGDWDAFEKLIRWETLRDLAILTIIYGLSLGTLVWFTRKH